MYVCMYVLFYISNEADKHDMSSRAQALGPRSLKEEGIQTRHVVGTHVSLNAIIYH